MKKKFDLVRFLLMDSSGPFPYVRNRRVGPKIRVPPAQDTNDEKPMAPASYLDIIGRGREAIESWVASHPSDRLNLAGADLRRIDLNGIDLGDPILDGADLRDADLGSARVFGGHLIDVDCRRANFNNADLRETIISGDFREANFDDATLHRAVVGNIRLDQALFIDTILTDVDLSAASGLELVKHVGPSVIDERTLRKSWPLPEIFLRGVGLSDQLIRYLPSLMSQAIEFYSCFISYSSKDQAFAQRLNADLQMRGVRCWFAAEDLRIGDKFRARIDEAIRLNDKLLLILSEESVQSPWVEDEVEGAMEKERKAKERGEERTVLFPIQLDDAVMKSDTAWAASIRRIRHIGDFRRWTQPDEYQRAFERLLRDLRPDGNSDSPEVT